MPDNYEPIRFLFVRTFSIYYQAGEMNMTRRTVHKRRTQKDNLTKNDIKLLICIGIFFCSVLLKYANFGIFPDVRKHLSAMIMNGANAKEVVAALGNAVSGDGMEKFFSSDAVATFATNLFSAKQEDLKSSDDSNKSEEDAKTIPESQDPDGEEPDPRSTYEDVFGPLRVPITHTQANEDESLFNGLLSFFSGGQKEQVPAKTANSDNHSNEYYDAEPIDLIAESAPPEELITPDIIENPEENIDDTGNKPFTIPSPDKVDDKNYAMNFKHQNPVSAVVTSKFGYRDHPVDGDLKFHYGVDLGAAKGTPIYAFADGTVETVGNNAIYGNYFIIRHVDGFLSFYGHCSKIYVKEGKKVKRGAKVALVGATGKVTGSHLHFEVRRYGKILNPNFYVSYR